MIGRAETTRNNSNTTTNNSTLRDNQTALSTRKTVLLLLAPSVAEFHECLDVVFCTEDYAYFTDPYEEQILGFVGRLARYF